jgi:hypothetical protein
MSVSKHLRGNLRQSFFEQFAEFTQHSYLTAYAAAVVLNANPQELADDLPVKLQELVDDDDQRWNEELKGSATKIANAKDELPRFVVELCVIKLDVMLHSLLDELAPSNALGSPNPFENNLQPVRDLDAEVYARVILLAEVRNSIIHNNRKLSDSGIQRLKDAGVETTLIDEYSRTLNRGLKLADFLQFKRAVRGAANMILKEHGFYQT